MDNKFGRQTVRFLERFTATGPLYNNDGGHIADYNFYCTLGENGGLFLLSCSWTPEQVHELLGGELHDD